MLEKSARILVRVWLMEKLNMEVTRLPTSSQRSCAEVGDDVRVSVSVGVRVGAMECQL